MCLRDRSTIKPEQSGFGYKILRIEGGRLYSAAEFDARCIKGVGLH